jgi:hypothetical protein
VVCGYNLRGLSIRALCPECGSGVTATILSVVDPLASELRPIEWPRLVATGLVMWTSGASLAVVLAWLPHLHDVLALAGIRLSSRPPAIVLGLVIGVGVSALGAATLIRPHAGISVSTKVLAAIGALLYAPLGYVLWRHQLEVERIGGSPYVQPEGPPPAALALLVMIGLTLAVLILCLRPCARLLVARSLLLRTGRVDRQTLLAVAGAAVLMSVGAGVLLVRPASPTLASELARISGTVVIAIGGVMLTIGMLGSLVDSVRIAAAILSPRRTARDVIRSGVPASGPALRPMSRLLSPGSAPTERDVRDGSDRGRVTH